MGSCIGPLGPAYSVLTSCHAPINTCGAIVECPGGSEYALEPTRVAQIASTAVSIRMECLATFSVSVMQTCRLFFALWPEPAQQVALSQATRNEVERSGGQ